MSRAIVTGASGFIGSHLVKKLGGANEIEHGHFKADYFSSEGPVYFLSTYGNMAHHQDCFQMVAANVLDLMRAIAGEPKYLLYMSSSSVILPVQTPYSRTKRAAEEILQALPELKSCIVRPYSVTGVGEQKEHLIPTLIRSCMEGEEMPFDPYPVHDFVDVEDVVDGLIRLADEQATGIFEFGNGIPYTNQAVREMVEEACGKKANVLVERNLRGYDSSTWYSQNPNCKYWMPKKTLIRSITEMMEAYRERS